jgi:hypothetical protein
MSKFSQMASKLGRRRGVRNPGGLAYTIGARKYGKKGMARKAAAGRRKAGGSSKRSAAVRKEWMTRRRKYGRSGRR